VVLLDILDASLVHLRDTAIQLGPLLVIEEFFELGKLEGLFVDEELIILYGLKAAAGIS